MQKSKLSDHQENVDPTNLFVKYLPSYLSDADLLRLFQPYGTVLSAKVMTDNDTGQSFGYGFVRFVTQQEADNALVNMNGYQIGKKVLLVKHSNMPREDDSCEPNENIYIKPLLPNSNELALIQLCKKFGHIQTATVMMDKQTHTPRLVGFVRFQTVDSARVAVAELHGKQLHTHRWLSTSHYHKKPANKFGEIEYSIGCSRPMNLPTDTAIIPKHKNCILHNKIV